MKRKHFCNYEHVGSCSDRLTHRAEYWMGEARKRLGKFAYWCSKHAASASHINGIVLLTQSEKRHPGPK